MKSIHDQYYYYITELGHTHTTDFCMKLSNDDLYDKDIRKRAIGFVEDLQQSIKQSDVVVLGATEQSIGTGIFMYIAYTLSKPIVALCEDYQKIPFLYDALNYKKLLIYECGLTNYKQVIPNALMDAQKLVDKRFTLLLPPNMVELLEKNHKETGQNRSEYIRELIRRDMKLKAKS